MSISLKENLNSAYLGAAHKLYPKKARRKIVAYVESYDDIPFWRTLLNGFENEERYFQIMLPSATSLTKGKKMALMSALHSSELGGNLIACVDSDYDYLLQGATALSHKLNNSRYIFQTYTYAIENHLCYAESLHEVCVQSTLNDRHIINFSEYMKQYSQIAYPLFLWSVYFYRMHQGGLFSMTDFCSYVRLDLVNLNHIYRSLERMKRQVNFKLNELNAVYPQAKEAIIYLQDELEKLGLTPDTTYLFIQGHHIKDNVVMKLLTPVCTQLRREREVEIKELAVHDEQFRNELTSYQNSQCNVELMLKKNTYYKENYLYQRLLNDVKGFLGDL